MKRIAYLAAAGALVATSGLGAYAANAATADSPSDQVRTAALLFTPLAIFVLVAMLHALARDLVLSPVEDLLGTMRRASAGDLRARTPIRRRDEMGAVAEGLNSMLERVGDFNAALQHEVERATEELRETNRQLAESAQRLFAARRELARSEQLAVAGQMAASVAHQSCALVAIREK